MFRFEYGTVTRYGRTFQNVLLTIQVLRRGPTTPYVHCYTCGLGSSPVARHYWGNHCLFSLPAGTKMFQFPAYAHRTRRCARPSAWRVVPFGNPRIKGHLHLPAAYRSLSRPSSLVRAKASSVRPFLLSFSVLSRTVTFFSLYFVCLACCLLIACFRSCLLVSKCQRSLCQPFWVALWRITDSNR